MLLTPVKPFTPGASARPEAVPIPWGLFGGVVALQACLQLGWIIYSTYQPVLLRRFGFADLLPVFGLQGGFLGLVVEPLSGALSDRHGDQARGRLMPITVAVSVVGLIFLTTAALLRQ